MGKPEGTAMGCELSAAGPVPGDGKGAGAARADGSLPIPTGIGVADVDQGPEGQKVAAMFSFDAMHVNGEAPFGEGSHATDAGMGVGVTGNATVTGSDVVVLVKTDWSAGDLLMEQATWGKLPLTHVFKG